MSKFGSDFTITRNGDKATIHFSYDITIDEMLEQYSEKMKRDFELKVNADKKLGAYIASLPFREREKVIDSLLRTQLREDGYF